MKWTKKRPTVPGWYWFRLLVRNYDYEDLFAIQPNFKKLFNVPMNDNFEPILVKVYEGDDILTTFPDDLAKDPDYFKSRIKAAKDFDFEVYTIGDDKHAMLVLRGLLMVGFGDCSAPLDDVPLRDEDMEWAGPLDMPEPGQEEGEEDGE